MEHQDVRIDSLSQFADAARGLAIILVVFGHVPGRLQDSPQILDWSVKTIYLFHVPLLFLLSGFTAELALSVGKNISNIGYLAKRSKRLIIPYLAMNVFYFGLQWFTQTILRFNRPVDLDLLLKIVTNPEHGPMGPLWFLYALFVISVMFAFLKFVLDAIGLKSLWCYLIVAIILTSFSWPESFCVNAAFYHLPFFIFGMVCLKHWDVFNWPPLCGFAISTLLFACIAYYGGLILPDPYLSLIVALSGCFSAMSLIKIIQDHKAHHFLMWIGRYAMGIYVLHMLIITIWSQCTRMITGSGLSLTGMSLMFVAALLLPIPIVRYGVERSLWLTSLVVGAPVRPNLVRPPS